MLLAEARAHSASLADDFVRRSLALAFLERRSDFLLAAYRIRGEAALSALRARTDSAIWSAGRRWTAPADDQRMWGTAAFGSFAAGMIGSAMGLDRETLEDVRLLGARINIFVSLYDHVLDSGVPAAEILSPDFESGSRLPLIPHLIRGLFVEAGRSRILIEAMQRMASGENQYRSLPEDVLPWRRKNGLIPVVMALAALGRAGGQVVPLPVLAHCYRLGMWAGWLDDVCDLEPDLREGQPNRVAAEQWRDAQPLIRLTDRLLHWWRARVPQPDLVDTFFYCATREIQRARSVAL